MNILEKEIEDVVWDAISKDKKILLERGLELHCKKYFRQLDLGEYGTPDIIGCSASDETKSAHIEVIELKKDTINVYTLLQAVRYAKAVSLIFEDYNYIDFELILVGKSLDFSDSFCYLPDVLLDVKIYTYSIDLEKGITFKCHTGWSLQNDTKFLNAKNKLIESGLLISEYHAEQNPA